LSAVRAAVPVVRSERDDEVRVLEDRSASAETTGGVVIAGCMNRIYSVPRNFELHEMVPIAVKDKPLPLLPPPLRQRTWPI
jgi:hypothetical protein